MIILRPSNYSQFLLYYFMIAPIKLIKSHMMQVSKNVWKLCLGLSGTFNVVPGILNRLDNNISEVCIVPEGIDYQNE